MVYNLTSSFLLELWVRKELFVEQTCLRNMLYFFKNLNVSRLVTLLAHVSINCLGKSSKSTGFGVDILDEEALLLRLSSCAVSSILWKPLRCRTKFVLSWDLEQIGHFRKSFPPSTVGEKRKYF